MKKNLKAGVSVADITPRRGLQLAGYPHFNRANTGIHDPLYASCVYLNNGECSLAVVSLDILKFPKQLVKTVRKRVEEQRAILGKNIMICCTHTHSGPLTSITLGEDGTESDDLPDNVYLKELEDKIVNVIIEAIDCAFPAEIGVEKDYCGKEQGVGGNRTHPDGVSDPEVWTTGIRDLAGRWRGSIVKYALHPTLIHGESTVITSDYPCYLRRYLSETKPGITTLFLQGTSGDQSTRYFRNGQSYDEAKRIGESIAKVADNLLNKMTLSTEVELFSSSVETDIDIRQLPSPKNALEDINAAQVRLDELKAAGAPYTAIRTSEVILLGAENTYKYALAMARGRESELLGEIPVEIQVIGIGDTRLVGIQGEMFVEYGLSIKSRSPFEKTYVVTLTNGNLPGYLCTKEAYEEGGYEAGSSLLTPKSGETIVDTAVSLLEKPNGDVK